MSIEGIKNHIAELNKKHRKLDEEILEQYRFHGNDNQIKQLKSEKLKLKTEIEKLESKLKAG